MEEFREIPGESILFELSPEELTVFFFALGLTIAQSLTIDELNVLGNGFFLVAQALFTISSQRTLLNDFIKAQQEKELAEKEKELPKKDKKTIEKEKKSDEEDFSEPPNREKSNKSIRNLESKLKKLQDQIEIIQKQIEELKN
ncbi:hypothetical protein SRRS_18280 [Sporomusa rhizae]|uniref:hypothetical protein n=1 Tax=Sporomusa rhizae TaxID=357999 RepID=UPI00352A1079